MGFRAFGWRGLGCRFKGFCIYNVHTCICASNICTYAYMLTYISAFLFAHGHMCLFHVCVCMYVCM